MYDAVDHLLLSLRYRFVSRALSLSSCSLPRHLLPFSHEQGVNQQLLFSWSGLCENQGRGNSIKGFTPEDESANLIPDPGVRPRACYHVILMLS